MRYIIAVVWLAGSLLAAPPMRNSQVVGSPRLLHTISASSPDLVEWHPEHNWIAYFKYMDTQHYVSILDITTLNTLVDIPASGGRSFSWNPNGTQLAILSVGPGNSFTLSIWRIVTTQQAVTVEKVQSFEIDWKPKTLEDASIDWHPANPLVALHDGSGLYLIHVDTGEIEAIESVGPGGARTEWSPDGQQLAFSYVSIFNLDTYEVVLNITIDDLPGLGDGLIRYMPPLQRNQTLSWSPDSQSVAFFFTERSRAVQGIYTLDVASQELEFNISHNPNEIVNAIAWSPDGTMIASVGEARFCETGCPNLIHVWDAESLDLLYRVDGHTDAIATVSWSPDSRRFATGSRDDTVRIWEIPQGE